MPDLISLYAQIDDDTLETMTSKGIMRRAGADAATVRFDSIGPAEIVGTIEGATVRLDEKGLAKARCTCPAATVCRHKTAVVLALREHAEAPALAATDEAETDWPSRLAMFDLAALQGAVGKTALREALRLMAVAETTAVESGRSSLKVRLKWAKDELEAAIPFQGDFAAIASSLPERRRPANHAAAVLAARQHFGLPAIEFEDAVAAVDAAFAPDVELLAAMLDILRRCYAQGFAIPSRALEEKLTLLAISGRAEAMPRLSACLRRVAEGLEHRRSRNVNHDPVALLREIAYGHALAFALSQRTDSDRLRKLAGTVRADYEPVGDVDLIGLGAALFETITGAVGVTSHFVEPATGRLFTASLARSTTHDTRFDPRSVYGSEPVWSQTLARLSSAAFKLSSAQVSDLGRLSLSQASRAGQVEPFRPTQETARTWAEDREGPLADLAHQSWTILADTLARFFSPSLDRPPPAARPVLLLPARLAPVAFDDMTQSLRWPMMDHTGAWISLSLDHDDGGRGLGARRIAALEAAVGDEGDKKPFAIVALARSEQGKIALEPMSLWGETQVLLDFPDRIKPLQTGYVSRIMTSLRRTAAQFAPPPPSDNSARQTALLLEAGTEALVALAEAGIHRGARERLLGPLARTYRIGSLAPLATLFSRVLEGKDDEISASALAAAHGLFTMQGLSNRLPVW